MEKLRPQSDKIMLRCRPALLAAVALAACSQDEGQPSADGTSSAEIEAAAVTPGARAPQILADAEQAANTGRVDRARMLYQTALKIHESAGDLPGQGNALLGMATLARYDGQGEVARDLYGRARAAFETAGDRFGVGRVAFALGELERARFNNEAALAAFAESQRIFRDHGEWRHESEALLGIAESQRRLGAVLLARDAVMRATALFNILEDRDGRSAADRMMGELRTYVDGYDDMRSEVARPLGFGEEDVGALIEAQAHLGFASVAALSGDANKARDLFRRAALVLPEFGVHGGGAGRSGWPGQPGTPTRKRRSCRFGVRTRAGRV